MFTPDQEYKRSNLHQQFGGQRQGGISTPTDHNIILLFTGDSGEQYGYSDGWTPDGLFFYVGEGQQGDMNFIRGNAAIRDHIHQGKDLHLFIRTRKGYVRYIGQMICTGYHYEDGPDGAGNTRRRIIFELAPFTEFLTTNLPGHNEQNIQQIQDLSLESLRSKAISASVLQRTPLERKQDYYYRSQVIKQYALRRASGICEGCKQPAPFTTKEGTPYLEVHHIRRLSDGGPDDPRWVVAICPNCHRKAHYAVEADVYNSYLSQVAKEAEENIATGDKEEIPKQPSELLSTSPKSDSKAK
jgi:5-methylcytosine-specific restriction enzyme A